jgi:hypothetical protein
MLSELIDFQNISVQNKTNKPVISCSLAQEQNRKDALFGFYSLFMKHTALHLTT